LLIIAMTVLGILTVPLAGGQLRRLADVRFDRGWTLAAALGLQLLATSVWPTMPTTAARIAHMVSYALAGWFLVANRRYVGLWIVAAGTAMNALAIALNKGVMPASAAALHRAGIIETTAHFANSTPVPHPRLQILGDVLAVPKGWPLANVFSIGDVVIVVGAVVTIYAICRVRTARVLTASNT
jgi:hypothetical protein